MEREKRSSGVTQVRTRKMDQRRQQGCGGKRLWIFLVLGAVLVVLGLVVGGIYLNIHSLTSSLQHAEIVPTYVPVGAVSYTLSVLSTLFLCCSLELTMSHEQGGLAFGQVFCLHSHEAVSRSCWYFLCYLNPGHLCHHFINTALGIRQGLNTTSDYRGKMFALISPCCPRVTT